MVRQSKNSSSERPKDGDAPNMNQLDGAEASSPAAKPKKKSGGRTWTGKKKHAEEEDEYEKVRKGCAFKPDADRKCTDVAFLMLFSFTWVLMFLVAAVGFFTGDPARLLYGTSSDGVPCGSQQYTTQRYIYYPQMQQDLIAALAEPEKYDPLQGGNPAAIPLLGICVSGCPSVGDTVTNDAGHSWAVDRDTKDIFFRCLPWNSANRTMTIRCASPALLPNATATQSLGYEPALACLDNSDCEAVLQSVAPGCTKAITTELTVTDKPAKSDPVMDSLQGLTLRLARWIGDLQMAAVPILVCGGFVAVSLGFVWLFLLEQFAKYVFVPALLCIA